jgi:type 1 glutamine amidotransferase
MTMGILLTVLLTAPMIVCGADIGEAGDSRPPTTIVFFGGCKTHDPGAHEHLRAAQLLKQCLDTAPGIPRLRTRIYLDAWPQDPSELDDAATIVLSWEGWGLHLVNARYPERAQKLDQLMKRGVGLVCFHAATAVEKSVESYYLDWVGGNKSPDYSLHPMARGIDVSLADPGHAICRGVGPMRFAEEEFYCKILFRAGDQRVRPILTAMLPPERPEEQVIGWAVERADGGRAFACTGPHYHASFQNEDLRRLALNAILWTAKIDVPSGGVRSAVLPADFDPSPAPEGKPPTVRPCGSQQELWRYAGLVCRS